MVNTEEPCSMDTYLIRTPVNSGQFHLSQHWKISYIFSKNNQLNTDTRIIWTLWFVPLVSLLTGFHCILLEVAKLLVASSLWLGCVWSLCWNMSIDPCTHHTTLVSINVISNFCWTEKEWREMRQRKCCPHTLYTCNFLLKIFALLLCLCLVWPLLPCALVC